MDPRFLIASTQDELRKAGIDTAEFWNELNSCNGPDDAVDICMKWGAIADEASIKS